MRAQFRSMLLFATMTAVPVGLAAAQVAPAPVVAPKAAPVATQKAVPDTAPQAAPPAAPVPAPVPPPVILPPPLWQIADVQHLLTFIRSIGGEGLDPRDYDPDGLMNALQTGDPMVISRAATDRFNLVSFDLALGHVRGKDRLGWHVVDKDLDEATPARDAGGALATAPDCAGRSSRCLPTHPQYGALKNALSISQAGRYRAASTASGSTWTAGAGCRATLATNISSSTSRLSRDAGRKWRDPLEAPRDRRRDQDADPAIDVDGHRRNPQPVVGSADQHHKGSRGQAGLCRAQGQGRQSRSAGASRRDRPTRSASSSS